MGEGQSSISASPELCEDDGGKKTLAPVQWGFVPHAACEPAFINARAETVATKPAYKHAFKNRRCLALAEGFFEWQKAAPASSPGTSR